MNKHWYVELGAEHWQRYTFARLEREGYILIGRILRGGQYGALAETADGRFVQINGDYVSPLNTSQVRRAIGLALLRRERLENQQRRIASPTVTVRRRRVLASAE